jgi:hypothetical protein
MPRRPSRPGRHAHFGDAAPFYPLAELHDEFFVGTDFQSVFLGGRIGNPSYMVIAGDPVQHLLRLPSFLGPAELFQQVDENRNGVFVFGAEQALGGAQADNGVGIGEQFLGGGALLGVAARRARR